MQDSIRDQNKTSGQGSRHTTDFISVGMSTVSQYLSVCYRKILILFRGELFSKFGTLLVKICLKQSHQDFQDGGGVKQGDHLPPHKYIKKPSACGILLQNPFWMLADGPRLPKGKPFSSEWSRAKDKDKKRDKEFERRICTLGWKSWRRKSLRTLSEMPAPSRDEGSSSEGKLLTVSSEGNTATSAWKAKQREFITEIIASQYFPAKN